MSRKGENIYRRKDGRWEGRVKQDHDSIGKTHYKYFYGKTYTEVKQKMKECQMEILLNCHFGTSRNISYSNLLKMWLDAIKPSVKESTFAMYYNVVVNRLDSDLGKHTVTKLTQRVIRQYAESLLISGRIDGKGGLSPKTVIDIISIVKSSIKYGQLLGFAVDRTICDCSIRNNSRSISVLSVEEQQRLKDFLLYKPDKYKTAVLICLYSGIRIGEVCALRWENIDFNDGILKVRATMQRIKNISPGETKTKIIISEPKSRCSIRDIPLPSFVIEALRPLQGLPDEYVLSDGKSNCIEPRTLQYHFKKYVEELGFCNVNYHALRHTFATRCIELGFEVKSLSEILGHANVNTTLNRYVHSSLQLKKENMKKLESL